MHLRSFRLLAVLILLTAGCAGNPTASPSAAPQPFRWTGSQPPLLMAHYMPWFQSKKISGSWGWHWTMDFSIPQQVEDGSWTKLASRYTPLTGPYDTSDPALLEYQLALMKLGGIDGVIVDWYGMDYYQDYGVINDATVKLFAAVKKAGLKFAICYEDQTVRSMVDKGRLKGEEANAYGQKVLAYLQNTWFGDPSYLKTAEGRPLLFVFGPQYYSAGADWQTLFSGISPKPLLTTLDQQGGTYAESSYPWPPMWAAQAGVLSADSLNSYLDQFYTRTARDPFRVGGAFPGFDDFYKDAGISPNHRYLDERAGSTLHETLQKALDAQPDIIQIITWNDYGESTQIEPTVQHQYRYLEIVQQARRAVDGHKFPFSAQDLRLPLQIYQLREKFSGDASVNAQLDRAASAIHAGDPRASTRILQTIK